MTEGKKVGMSANLRLLSFPPELSCFCHLIYFLALKCLGKFLSKDFSMESLIFPDVNMTIILLARNKTILVE